MSTMYKKKYYIDEFVITKLTTKDFLKENCYIVNHKPSNESIVIDPGYNYKEIFHEINMNSKDSIILLSHAHYDHLGDTAELMEHFNLACFTHKFDKRLLMHAPIYAMRFGNTQVRIPNDVIFFDEDFAYSLGNKSCRVIHTPGHTPGGVCIVFDKFLFTGDTLLYKAVGRTDLPGSNVLDLRSSINRILTDVSNDAIIFPGHGEDWIIKEAKIWWSNNKELIPSKKLNSHI